MILNENHKILIMHLVKGTLAPPGRMKFLKLVLRPLNNTTRKWRQQIFHH